MAFLDSNDLRSLSLTPREPEKRVQSPRSTFRFSVFQLRHSPFRARAPENLRLVSALYQSALCLCYVSFFGPENLPPLEAFGLGCPVIAADVPGASEQLGDAAIRVNPSNELEIAGALKLLSQDKTKRDELIRRGKERARRFTGRDFAKGLIASLDEFEPIRRSWPAGS